MKKYFKIMVILIVIAALLISVVGCGNTTSSDVVDVVENEQTTSESSSSTTTATDTSTSTNLNISNASDLHTATFITNNGSAVDQILGTVISTAPTTEREGYQFTGWHLLDTLEDAAVTFPYYMSANTVFYASWLSIAEQPISTVEDLIAVGTDTASMAADYYLTNDIDLTGVDWIPLGLNYELVYDDDGELDSISLEGADAPQAYTGTFDGRGYSIINMTITPFIEEEMSSYLSYGLFARFNSNGTQTATVKDLNIVNYNITLEGGLSKFYLGGLVGLVDDAIITNCTASGVISNPQSVVDPGWEDIFGMGVTESERVYGGGLIGVLSYGTVTGCSTSGTISSYSTGEAMYFGGLVGQNQGGTINSSSSSTDVYARYAGGLVGYNGYISTDEDYVVGTDKAKIYQCFATGYITGSLSYPAIAGGLVGLNESNGYIDNSYATGDTNSRTAGGLVGVNNFNYMEAAGGLIANCFSAGDVYASEYGGGLVGRAESDVSIEGKQNHASAVYVTGFAIIKYCISYGDVTVSATETKFIDDDGNEQIVTGVYSSAFAGSLIGHANEPILISCLALGNVSATSKRPVGDGDDDFVYNTVFCNNLIGQSSNLATLHSTSYALDTITVYRNDTLFTGYSGYESYSMSQTATLASFNTSAFYTNNGFSAATWNLSNLDIANGSKPTLIF